MTDQKQGDENGDVVGQEISPIFDLGTNRFAQRSRLPPGFGEIEPELVDQENAGDCSEQASCESDKAEAAGASRWAENLPENRLRIFPERWRFPFGRGIHLGGLPGIGGRDKAFPDRRFSRSNALTGPGFRFKPSGLQ